MHMFFPLLAKSGAASAPQMRRVSFEFCFEKFIVFDGERIAAVK